MHDYRLYAVSRSGPERIPVAAEAGSIHDLLKSWPVGVYTVMRTYHHNQFLSLDMHLERLDRSPASPGWTDRPDHQLIRNALDKVCSEYPHQDSVVRIDILADRDRRLDADTRLMIALGPFVPLAEDVYARGVVVGTSVELSRRDPAVKSADFVDRRRDFLKKHPGLFEVLLVDQDGSVREGASSNFYGVRDNAIITPEDGILPGTARQIVLTMANDLGIEVRLSPVRLDQIAVLDEAAISSSSRGVVPVIQIDETAIGSGQPGTVVKQLMRSYQDYVDRSLRPAICE